MKSCIVIPCHNEKKNIEIVLNSILTQTTKPNHIIVVDDHSTDDTYNIVFKLSKKHECLNVIKNTSSKDHLPGKKVIDAFYCGLNSINIDDFDLIGKFDSDIILPNNYFEKVIEIFKKNEEVGIAGGNLYILKDLKWIFENISEKTKVRGPIKLYRKECFQEIGGLKRSIGWDTVDELLAQYHGWKVCTDQNLKVKHLKPTGKVYSKEAKHKQGEAFYKMRYGYLLTLIASLKLSFKKKNPAFFFDTIKGYKKAKRERIPFIVSEKEGIFIRDLRWKNIRKKLF